MRKWHELSDIKKTKRVCYTIRDFFKSKILGDYKRGGLLGAYHWLRCHIWNRYHIINLRNKGDYNWGWIDRDHAMLLACFTLLVDYVEGEKPFNSIIDWVDSDICIADEIKELYHWWKHQRQLIHSHPPEKNQYLWQKELEEYDDKMLDRLIKIRKNLWT